jgi:hypothetical protein
MLKATLLRISKFAKGKAITQKQKLKCRKRQLLRGYAYRPHRVNSSTVAR